MFGNLERRDDLGSRLDSIYDNALELASIAKVAPQEDRIEIAKTDVLVFALIYLEHHLQDHRGEVSINWTNIAITNWANECIPQHNKVLGFIAAPRGSGKTTTSYLIVPLWTGAYQFERFIWMGADSAPQAEQHLETLRRELADNELLRFDFPDFCTPKRSVRGKRTADTDRRGDAMMSNGIIFRSRGLDSRNLGTKVGEHRPGVMLIDDPEPGEGQYTVHQIEQRLKTMRYDIFPMGHDGTKILITGTPTRPDAVGDKLTRYARGELQAEEAEWIEEERLEREVECRVVEPIQEDESYWPNLHPVDELEKKQKTTLYARNYDSRPGTQDGWWEYDMFEVEKPPTTPPQLVIMYVDPCSEEEKGKSWSGWCIAALWPNDARLWILDSGHTKKVGEALMRALKIAITRTPVQLVVVETNQGGGWVKPALNGLGVRVETTKTSIPKPDRARQYLTLFQTQGTGVIHAKRMPEMWSEMVVYDGSGNTRDDILDSAAGAYKVLGRFRVFAAIRESNAKG